MINKIQVIVMRIPQSLTLSSFLMENVKNLISKFSLELTIRWLFSVFDIKLLFWNHLKFLLVFSWSLKTTESRSDEKTYGVLPSA